MDTITLTANKNNTYKKTNIVSSPSKIITMKELKSDEFWNDIDEIIDDNKNLSTIAGTAKDQINFSQKVINNFKVTKKDRNIKNKHLPSVNDDHRGKSAINSSMKKISNVYTLDLINYKRYVNKLINNDIRDDLNGNNNFITLKINKKTSNLSVDTNKLCNPSFSVLDVLTKNEDFMEKYRNKRTNTIQENSHNLYMTSFSKKEKHLTIAKEFSRYKDEMEIQYCSFKPTLFTPKKPIEGDLIKLGFFERREQIKEKTKEKYDKIRNEKVKGETDPCTFKPEMRKRSEPNYNKKFPENKQINKFLERQQIAQQRKEELKILDPNIRIKSDINETYQKLINKRRENDLHIYKEKIEKTLSESPKKRTLVNEKEMNIIKQQLHAIPTISYLNDKFNI